MTSYENTNARPFVASAPPAGAPPAARILFALLARLARGELLLVDPDGRAHRFGKGHDDAGRGEFRFRDWRLGRAILTGGDVAFAEAWIDGRWDTPDLPALMTVLAHNQPTLERAFYGHAWQRALFRFKHWLNANSRRKAKRNIVAHYDLGNDFYRLWLDPTMTYSSALFDGDYSQPLAAAQHAKYRRILAELALPPGAHILEIGCGWGGFAEVAARAGYRVTGLSLSDAQTAYARERIARAGLADRVTLRVQDYRDERGTYDGVASIEMFEAVGEKYWPTFFESVRDRLAPGGCAGLQVITIPDWDWESYRHQIDFTQKYVFPGGIVPSLGVFRAVAEREGLGVAEPHFFGQDYARTLAEWLGNFDGVSDSVTELGFDERFRRMWRYYLAWCNAGFASSYIDVMQVGLEPGR